MLAVRLLKSQLLPRLRSIFLTVMGDQTTMYDMTKDMTEKARQ